MERVVQNLVQKIAKKLTVTFWMEHVWVVLKDTEDYDAMKVRMQGGWPFLIPVLQSYYNFNSSKAYLRA